MGCVCFETDWIEDKVLVLESVFLFPWGDDEHSPALFLKPSSGLVRTPPVLL